MTDKYRAGVQSIFKPRTARSQGVGTLTPIGEYQGSAEYARLPIWMAALITSGCRATAAGSDCNVQWNYINGKAQYTNHASSGLLIQPLGIRLESGQTLTAFWTPGETNYTFEIVREHDRCA